MSDIDNPGQTGITEVPRKTRANEKEAQTPEFEFISSDSGCRIWLNGQLAGFIRPVAGGVRIELGGGTDGVREPGVQIVCADEPFAMTFVLPA